MILGISYLEWFGYLASIITGVSMLMSSILRLRWVNLVGASMFSTYGFLIGSIPVGMLNLFIVLIDLYYLRKMYSRKEFFKTLEIRSENKYLLEFLEFYNEDIQKYFPKFSYSPEMNLVSFFVLRNMAVAGVFLARKYDEETLYVGLDFVIPEYRDFKLGRYIYNSNNESFKEMGFKQLCTSSPNPSFGKYLKKMGFKAKTEEGKLLYFKEL